MTTTTTGRGPAGRPVAAAKAAPAVNVHPDAVPGAAQAGSASSRPVARSLTEADVWDVFAQRAELYPSDDPTRKLVDAIDGWADGIGYVDLDAEGRYDFGQDFLSELWADLRPSEQARLAELVTGAKARALSLAREAIHAELVAAALAFAGEYPDAPRAVR